MIDAVVVSGFAATAEQVRPWQEREGEDVVVASRDARRDLLRQRAQALLRRGG